MTRRTKKLKIMWKFVGDESPEKRKESEIRVNQAYNSIFSKAFENLRKNK